MVGIPMFISIYYAHISEEPVYYLHILEEPIIFLPHPFVAGRRDYHFRISRTKYGLGTDFR